MFIAFILLLLGLVAGYCMRVNVLSVRKKKETQSFADKADAAISNQQWVWATEHEALETYHDGAERIPPIVHENKNVHGSTIECLVCKQRRQLPGAIRRKDSWQLREAEKYWAERQKLSRELAEKGPRPPGVPKSATAHVLRNGMGTMLEVKWSWVNDKGQDCAYIEPKSLPQARYMTADEALDPVVWNPMVLGDTGSTRKVPPNLGFG